MAKIMKILLLLLLFVAGGTSATKPKCEELKGTVELANDPEICEVVSSSGDATLGNSKEPMTLDISKADETTLNTFLAKFTEIHGAIVMEGNDQVATLNLGTIKEFDGKKISPDDKFIFIRNNPKLAKIDWNNAVDVMDRDVVMLIYNNPLLAATSLDTLHTVLNGKKKIQHHIQRTELNECQFEYPLNMTIPDPSKYIAPSAEFLKNCKKIKGDFIVENAKLAELGPFELGADACLRLVNVDMKDVKITAAANTGSETCKDGRKSEITGNPNLCGDELEALHKYYKDPAAVAVKMDPATCTKPCSSGQQSGLYIICEPPTTPPPPTTAPPSTNSTIDPAGGAIVQQTPDTTPNSNDSSSDKMEPWVIAVIAVVGGLALAAIITLPVLWWMNCLPCCRRHKDDPKKKDPPGGKNKHRDNKKKLEHPHDEPKKNPAAVEEGTVTDVTASDATSNSKDKTMDQHESMVYTLKNIDETSHLTTSAEPDVAKPAQNMAPNLKKTASVEKPKQTTMTHSVTGTVDSKGSAELNQSKEETMDTKNDDPSTVPVAGTQSNENETLATDAGMSREEEKRTHQPLCNIKFSMRKCGQGFITALIAFASLKDGLNIEFFHTDYKGLRKGDDKWGEFDEDDRRIGDKLIEGNLKRYTDVRFRHKTAVKLRTNKKYVSANWVNVASREYICAEAPTEDTTLNYWLMLFENRVKNTVMLCNFKENGRDKCFKYFPVLAGAKPLFFGDIKVECIKRTKFSSAIIKRRLKLTYNGETWYLNHFQFMTWPDHGVPTIDDGMQLFPLLDFIRQDSAPIVVHCSAGVGRTGAFVYLSAIMDLLGSGKVVDRWVLLRLLRNQRASAIQEFHQYLYVFVLLAKKASEEADGQDEKKILQLYNKLTDRMNAAIEKANLRRAKKANKNPEGKSLKEEATQVESEIETVFEQTAKEGDEKEE